MGRRREGKKHPNVMVSTIETWLAYWRKKNKSYEPGAKKRGRPPFLSPSQQNRTSLKDMFTFFSTKGCSLGDTPLPGQLTSVRGQLTSVRGQLTSDGGTRDALQQDDVLQSLQQPLHVVWNNAQEVMLPALQTQQAVDEEDGILDVPIIPGCTQSPIFIQLFFLTWCPFSSVMLV